jgi:diaminohydroxyphosphoribosylaminopyrimidine deaminase/5-amino-6-(5-phosphoribosylamino)uracil reductase
MKEFYMQRAIELANKGAGFVSPNPLSGTVVVKENRIIGQAYFKGISSESSIINAINTADENLSGSEIYINIEPNLLDKKGEKFLEDIFRKGVKKVYIGSMDCNEANNGKTAEMIASKGIEVEKDILKEECEELNEIYSYYIKTKKPFVFVKWAMTLDGKLASRTGDSKWISSDGSLKFVHYLRQKVAAIMVGENTVKLDDPMLTTRLEGVDISNPLRIIISKYGDLPEDAKVLKVDDRTKTLIISSTRINKEKEEELLKKGVEVLKFEEKDGNIDFKELVETLGRIGIDSLYIEGGSAILASAFDYGIVNKVYAAVAPKIIGGSTAITPVGGIGIEKMRDAIVLKKVTHEIIGNDVIIKGYI